MLMLIDFPNIDDAHQANAQPKSDSPLQLPFAFIYIYWHLFLIYNRGKLI